MEEEFLTNVALDRFFIFFQKVARKSFSCVSSRRRLFIFYFIPLFYTTRLNKFGLHLFRRCAKMILFFLRFSNSNSLFSSSTGISNASLSQNNLEIMRCA